MLGICCSPVWDANELKRIALLCDAIEVGTKFSYGLHLTGSSGSSREIFRQALVAAGVKKIKIDQVFDFALPYIPEFQQLDFLHQAGLIRFRPRDADRGPGGTWSEATSLLTVETPRGELSLAEGEQIDELYSRLRAASLRSAKEENIVLIGSRFPELQAWTSEQLPSVESDVISIVLERLPEPDEQTPWQDLIDFRREEKTRAQSLALRRWIRKMASGEFKQAEIIEELEYLYYEYEHYMQIQQMKINKGALETLVTVTAEIAEDLVKIKWGNLAKVPFVVKQRKIDLLEAERNAPGREIAYLATTRRRFAERT